MTCVTPINFKTSIRIRTTPIDYGSESLYSEFIYSGRFSPSDYKYWINSRRASSSSNFGLSYTHLYLSSLLGYNIFFYNCFIRLRHTSKALNCKDTNQFLVEKFSFCSKCNGMVFCDQWRSDRLRCWIIAFLCMRESYPLRTNIQN